jgi:RNA polymerase sigma factor (sigma-70 family)
VRDGHGEAERVWATQDYLRSRSLKRPTCFETHQSWDDFYAEYAPYVRRMVRSWNMSAADEDDCVQEIWMEIISKLTSLDYDPRRGHLRGWLFLLVRRKMIRHLRRRKSRKEELIADPEKTLTGSEAEPWARFAERERRDMVRRTLASMRRRTSQTNYRMLYLRWIDGRSTLEIAEAVKLTPEQVRYRLSRMKTKLHSMLAHQMPSGQ